MGLQLGGLQRAVGVDVCLRQGDHAISIPELCARHQSAGWYRLLLQGVAHHRAAGAADPDVVDVGQAFECGSDLRRAHAGGDLHRLCAVPNCSVVLPAGQRQRLRGQLGAAHRPRIRQLICHIAGNGRHIGGATTDTLAADVQEVALGIGIRCNDDDGPDIGRAALQHLDPRHLGQRLQCRFQTGFAKSHIDVDPGGAIPHRGRRSGVGRRGVEGLHPVGRVDRYRVHNREWLRHFEPDALEAGGCSRPGGKGHRPVPRRARHADRGVAEAAAQAFEQRLDLRRAHGRIDSEPIVAINNHGQLGQALGVEPGAQHDALLHVVARDNLLGEEHNWRRCGLHHIERDAF